MSRNPSEIFPERLKHAREKLRDLSQVELAERSGLQGAAISHFENGLRKPSFENLRRLADALEVTTDYLIGRSNDPAGSAAPADPLYRDISKLSTSDRDTARLFLQTLAKRSKERSKE